MSLETLKLKLVGQRPLLLHNGKLADPTDEQTKLVKQVANKKGKTDSDFEQLKKLEWFAGLYTDEKGRIAVTEDMVLGCAIEGAKKSKKGKQMKAGVLGAQPFFQIDYKGPKDPLELFATGKFCDYRSVVVSQRRTMRARPRFDTWTVTVELLVETSTINTQEVIDAMETAGRVVGLGDFRPRFGRFTVEAA